ncbi:MAG: SMC-Scp complex subunit ScpB [Planctomycetota bacterium]|jgi:segregation and condensation protein B
MIDAVPESDDELPDVDASEQVDVEDDWPAEDLETAYRRALEANDSVEWDFSHYTAEDADTDETGSDAVDESTADDASEQFDNTTGSDTPPDAKVTEPVPQRVNMRQVIEAALFVGGDALTSKRLCYLLKGDYDLDAVEAAIDDLNHVYNEQSRPYEIRLGEGGYRIVLREEFNPVRNRVFGIGPKEVRLSQDALEVLALIAYRQPVTQADIERLGKAKPGGTLRQLLRRQLIELHRDEKNRKRVTYTTTPRFLSVFGIGSIDDLPQADELAFK